MQFKKIIALSQVQISVSSKSYTDNARCSEKLQKDWEVLLFAQFFLSN